MPSPSVGKRPQGIKKQQPVRRSARIQSIQRPREQTVRKDNLVGGIQAALSHSLSNSAANSKA